MKVGKTDKAQSTSSKKKTGKTQGTSGTFSEFLTSAPKNVASTNVTHSVAQVDALLSIQEVKDPTSGKSKKRMIKRADDILDTLDKIKISMLSGTLTVGEVVDIADVIAVNREKVDDPKIMAVLDEIDLRAQVELAKLQKSMG